MNLREKLVRQYLPLWAKETVFRENKILKEENEMLKQKIRELDAWAAGVKFGAKYVRKLPREKD